jgi:acetylornithine/N-succinyldiaminopimelate aminotransferase
MGLADIGARTGAVREVRGVGLLLGVALEGVAAADVAASCRSERLIVNAVGPDVIRLAPPLTLSAEVADLALGVIERAIDHAATHARRTEPV